TLADQRILPGAWYPLEGASEIMIAVMKVLGSSTPGEGMAFIGGDLAENDLQGLYAHLVTAGDVPKSLRRSVLLWHNYFDKGKVTLSWPDPAASRCNIRLEGFEQTIPYCNGIIGMGRVVIRIASGGKTCDVTQTQCTLTGDPVCEFDCRWNGG
ncbi:MAG: hypothetical protein ACE5FC_06440, partial [Myxococcota bacterium]